MGNKILTKIIYPLLFIAFAVLFFSRGNLKPPAASTRGVSFIDASDRLKHYNWSSLIDTPNGSGVCALDANNDGLQDLFFPGLGDFNIETSKLAGYELGNRLYINQGNDAESIPKFGEISQQAGVRNLGKLGVGCSVADYNNDGWEDILVTNATKGAYYAAYGSWDPSGSGRRFFPPGFFHTDKTDGKYDFPEEGGVTLFENQGINAEGSPRFIDVTIKAGLTRGGNGTAAVFGDVNNDGFVDLFVGNYSDYDFVGFSYKSFAGQFNVLYRNNGNGTFSDVTDQAGVSGQAEFVYTTDGQKQFGYDKNLKDSKGRTVGDPAGNTLSAAFFDYNDDGLVDLITADDIPGRIRLYKNLGNFKFIQTSDENDMGLAGAWMGFGIGDINGDQTQDVFAVNFGGPWGAQDRPGSKETFMLDIQNSPNRASIYHGLWINDNGKFSNLAKQTMVDWGLMPEIVKNFKRAPQANSFPGPEGLEAGEFGFGTLMFDYDNDQNLDLMWIGALGRAELQAFRKNPGRLLKNLGGGNKFADVAWQLGVTDLTDKHDYDTYQNGRGLIAADFNNDGYNDLVMTNAGGFDSSDEKIPKLEGVGDVYGHLGLVKEYAPGPTFFYVSSKGSNNWLKLKLIGSKSNKSAIGAKVTIKYRDGNSIQSQVREVRAGESFESQNSLEPLFGLGVVKKIDRLEIRWPYSKADHLQILTDIEVNQRLVVEEK